MDRYKKRSLTVDKQWNEFAQSSTLGFRDEEEMFTFLAKEWTDIAIANLLGNHVNTIQRRRNKYNIKPAYKSRGGWRKRHERKS